MTAKGDDGDVRTVIAGGGTAGHVLPGLAIASALVDRGAPRSSVRFVGSARGLETDLVPAAGFELVALPGRGIQRRLTAANLASIGGILRATWRSIRLIRRWRPDVMVVLGGYAAAPCVVAAVLWRVPMVVAEQNARAGLANRVAGRFAKSCAVPFAETDLPRAVVTGNPVRDEVLAVDRDRDSHAARVALGLPPDRLVIAVASGSLGARSINLAVRGLAGAWADRADIAIRHVIGKRDWEDLGEPPVELVDAELVYQTVRYEEHMELVLAAADLFVSRAGGTTVAEYTAVGVASLLVPLPIATRDHQRANARALVDAGAAVLVSDDELDAERLASELEPLIDHPEELALMAQRAAAAGRRDAAIRVAELLEQAVR